MPTSEDTSPIFLIIAGGKGRRLWPYGMYLPPKPFISLDSDVSLFDKTYNRCLLYTSKQNIFVLTNKENQPYVLPTIKETQLIFEPFSYNTAYSLIYGIETLCRQGMLTKDRVVIILPSDQVFSDEAQLFVDIQKAQKLANKGKMVTLASKATHQDPGYGYLVSDSSNQDPFYVHAFLEKPTQEMLQKCKEMQLYWNIGIYVSKVQTLMQEIKRYAPKMFALAKEGKDPSSVSPFSIDQAVMEKTKNLWAIPHIGKWQDLGTWDRIYEYTPKDQKGNAFLGNVREIHAKNCLTISAEKPIYLFEVEDLVVVDTKDALLVTKRGKTERAGKVLSSLLEKEAKNQ